MAKRGRPTTFYRVTYQCGCSDVNSEKRRKNLCPAHSKPIVDVEVLGRSNDLDIVASFTLNNHTPESVFA